LDLGFALTGDYLIRCNGGSVTVFEIEIKSDKVFSTKQYGNYENPSPRHQ